MSVQSVQPKQIATLLHLSDIHFGHGSAAHRRNQLRVLDRLVEDLETTRSPDILVLTGDVGFSGKRGEYAEARAFLKRLKRDATFMVPGNHDVTRTKKEDSAMDWSLLTHCREGLLNLGDVGRSALRRIDARAGEYAKFERHVTKSEKNRHVSESPRILRFETEKYDLLFIHWNTALLSNDEFDNGRLRIPEAWTDEIVALRTKRRGTSRPQLRFLLTHHPFDWLANGARIADKVRPYIDVHLHGHVHEPAVISSTALPGGSVVTLTAGAAHDEELPLAYRDIPNRDLLESHSYSLITVEELPDETLQLRVRPRRWNGRREAFLPDQLLLKEGQPEAVLKLPAHSNQLEETLMFENDAGMRHVISRIEVAKEIFHLSAESGKKNTKYRSTLGREFNAALVSRIQSKECRYHALYAPRGGADRRERLAEFKKLGIGVRERPLPGLHSFFVFDPDLPEAEVVFVVNEAYGSGAAHTGHGEARNGYFISIRNPKVAGSFRHKFEQLQNDS